MTSTARLPARTSVMTKLLAVGLMILTVLPLLIFATDLPNRGFMRNARQRVQQQAGAPRREVDREVRRQRISEERAKVRVNPGRFSYAIVFQLVMLVALAVVGRRLFSLRL